VAGVAHQNVDAQSIAAGVFEAGDMLLSIPENSPMWGIGQYDRVLMMNSTDVFSQPLERNGATERLLFTAKSFTRAFSLDPVTRDAVEWPLPVVDANGNLSWPAGDGPPDGTVYSLTGEKYDEYFVLNSYPSDRGEHSGARLPKRVNLRVWDLFARSNVSG